MHLKSTIILMFCASSIIAQLSNLEVLSSGSGDIEGERIKLSWTLGEAFITSLQEDNLLITEGFHQPIILVEKISEVTSSVEKPRIHSKVDIRPNPVSDALIIYTDNVKPNEGEFQIQIFDESGKLAIQRNKLLHGQDNTIEVSALNSGLYFLRVIDQKGIQINTFKIIIQHH